MKFKDVRTIDSILLEYGLKPGAPTPVGNQQSGAVAKTTPQKPTTPPKKDLGSPTVTQGLDIPEPEAPEPQSFRAMDLGDGDEFKDKTGKVVGKVVSKVGDGPQPDKLVVDDGKGEYSFIDPEDEVFIDAPVTEKTEKSGKYRKKNHRKALNKVKPRVRQEKNKVKRLARLNLHESKQSLFEINFRKKEVINSSLDAQIRCGWEAESLWEDLEEQSDDVDNMSIQEIDDNFGGVDWDSISEHFTDWIYENKQEEYMDDAINEFVNDREDDEDYLNDFIENEGIEESDWDHVREDALRREYGDERYEEEGAEELSELYGYEDENWAREYVDEYRRGDFRSYLEELAGDDDDVRQAAYEEASENYDYDDWINDQWYSMSSFCDDYGIEFNSHGSISEVADRLETFISEQSAFHDHAPEHGQYGDTSGSTTEYAVETDSSIDGYGTGAEIISPVFSTPRRMLAEMEKFFKWFQSEGVATNNSTGLHITMSYNPQEGETVNHEEGSSLVTANKVKMAVLLGDQYLLSEWGRGNNSYAKSQLQDLKKAIQKLKVEGTGTESIKYAEKFLEDNISTEKFRSIHFKTQTDSKTNTKLIEFRIGGGEDYHMEFKRVFSSVVRYATTMIAGHTDQYQGDYIKALSRLLNKMNEVSTRDKEEVENLKSSAEDYAGHPILDSHKAIASAKNYLDFVEKMLDSMKTLNDAKRYLEPDADKKWKAKWTEYLENTADDLEDFDSSLRKSLNKITENINEVKTGETIKAYMRPDMRPPSETAVNVKNKGIRLFAEALGMLALDISNGKARSQPNAKSIGALRNFLRIHDISESDVDANMKMAMEDLNFDSDLSPKAKIDIIRKGIATLFKRDIIVKPDYITAPQVEALVKGLWNVFNAEEFNDQEKQKVKKLCSKLRLGDASLNIEQKEIESDISRMIDNAIDKREFNDFYNYLTRSGYNNTTFLVAPGHIYNKKSFNELIKFVKQSKPYTEPVSRSHNPNIYNDDSYEENALSKYTLLLRRRFAFLEDQHDTDVSVARQSLKQILTLTDDFFKENKIFKDEPWEKIVGIPELDIRNPEPDNPRVKKMSEKDKETYLELYSEADSQNFLGVMIYRLERLDGTSSDINSGETERRTVSIMSEFVTDSIRECLGAYYKNKDRYPQYYVIPEVKSLIKQRFESLATFMRGIDKVFVDNGFESQDTSIKRKQQLDTDAEAFRKKTANRPLATVNIPAHSWIYMKPELHEEFMVLMQEQSYLDAPKPSRDLIKKMVDSANNVGEYAGSFSEHIGIIVIPAAHWSQVNDALNGMDIIKLQQKVGNNSQTWRLKNYHKILDEFKRIYRHPQPNYIFEEWPQLDGTDRDFISKTFNIEFTGKLDGRAGMGDVDELLPNEEAKNQVSGEPLETNSAISWSISDGNSKKQFAAYDWNKYHGKDADALKKATADEMKNGIGFYKAIQKAIESKNPSIKINADLINVAGVQDYTGDSSNTIGAKTNWINLANYFKIEHGVNNQGIELLKKTYQMFDGNFQGEFASEGHSIDRWLDGVKKAKQYIEKNYKESGGNYFRKDDAEGQPSGANYGNPSGPTVNDLQTQSEKPDYDKARTKHPGFNTMMQNGMQNYLVRGEVNDLVGFLNNPDNDNVFKSAVLNTLANRFEINPGYPFDSFQDALAVTRRHGYESVFAKFDKLPLQEQLDILNKSKVLEGKVIKNNVATKTTVFKENVPDLNRIRIINKLLADHFPAGDLKKQMLAYEAIPVPQMLTDFRGLIAQAGPDACARGIVRHYVNALGDEEKQQINLNEWSKHHIRTLLKEAPMQLVQDFKNLVIKVAELERDVQSKCANPKLAKQCSYASKELDDYKQKMSTVQNQIMQFTSTEKDIDAAIDLGREQTTSEIRNYQSTVDKLLNKLSDKISGGFEYITFSDSGIEQAKEDTNGKKLTVRDKKKQESEVKSVEQIKQALIGYFKDPELFSDNPEFTRAEIVEFLTAAANGEILAMEDIMTIGTDPNLPEMVTFTEVVERAAERHGNQRYIGIYNKLVDDGLMYQTVANTTSGNVGPGELALLLLAAPAEKGARGDLSVAGKEVEIKSGSYSVGDSKTTAGGKFNSDFVVKGNLAGGTLNKLLTHFFKQKLNKDFKKEWKAFMAKQDKPNTIVRYKLDPARMNLPAISSDSFAYVYNPFFKEQNITRDQFRSLARIFSQTTFSGEARLKNGHFYEVVKTLAELHGVNGWYAKQIEEIATSKGINESLLKRLIIALQFQSYYINKGHDQILYINKTNQKLTNVTNAKDLIDKFDRGIVVAVKDINLTDTQQTAAHSITAGL
jgi:hypothetical protein